jgi:hypothetical protein
MDSCPCCQDHEREHYLQLAYGQTNSAFKEHQRLKSLYGDVCWYNFEVNASRWKKPWLETDQMSLVRLSSDTTPPWYEGVVGLAPLLPPVTIGKEVKESLAEYKRALFNERDAIDYAPPNGKKYLELCRTTKVPTSLVY